MNIFLTTIEQSLLLLPLAFGIYLSYSIIKATDMTVDGSFVLGAAVFARLLSESFPVSIAMLSAIIAGSICGICVSLIQHKDRVDSLIAGILMLFMLFSINLQILGRPNISLFGYETLVTKLENYTSIPESALILMTAISITLLLYYLLYCRIGLNLRAFGENKILLRQLGRNIEAYRMLAFAISNALAACCGAITAQINGYADINMGFGMALTGIGAVIIGQQLCKKYTSRKKYSPGLELFSCFLGVYIYYLTVNIFLALNIDPVNLKLVLGLILVIFMRSAYKQPPGGFHA